MVQFFFVALGFLGCKLCIDVVVLLWPSVHILVITVAMNVGGYVKLLMELCKTPFEAFATGPK